MRIAGSRVSPETSEDCAMWTNTCEWQQPSGAALSKRFARLQVSVDRASARAYEAWRDVSDGAEQAVIAEPVDPAQGCHFDG
jgi:hypothetical protein